MRKRLLLLGLLACAPRKFVFALALVFSADDYVLAQATEAKAPFVKVRATAEKESGDGKQDVLITLDIQKGVFLIANPPGLEEADASKTQVDLIIDGKPVNAAISYPPGMKVKDRVVGDYHIYQGSVVIRASVRRSPGDTRPVEVAVRAWGFRPTH